jgi:hypothetical protein
MKVFLRWDTTSESIWKSKQRKRKERVGKKNLKRERDGRRVCGIGYQSTASYGGEGKRDAREGGRGRRDADGGGGDSRSSGRRGRGGATQANHRRSSAAIANNTASPKFSRAYDRSPAFPGHHDPVSADMKGAGRGGGGLCVRAARGKKSGTVHTVNWDPTRQIWGSLWSVRPELWCPLWSRGLIYTVVVLCNIIRPNKYTKIQAILKNYFLLGTSELNK